MPPILSLRCGWAFRLRQKTTPFDKPRPSWESSCWASETLEPNNSVYAPGERYRLNRDSSNAALHQKSLILINDTLVSFDRKLRSVPKYPTSALYASGFQGFNDGSVLSDRCKGALGKKL